MLDDKEKESLINQLDTLKKDIIDKKNNLNSLDKLKESLFEKKNIVGSEIKKSIDRIKELRDKRNSLTTTVKDEKKERDALNNELNEKKKNFFELKKNTITDTQNVRIENPERISQQINILETRIETEGLSFDKEKLVMKQIKELKKKLVQSREIHKDYDTIRKEDREIRDLKKRADDIHKKIQDEAKKSQEYHEELIVLSKKIDEQRVEEEQINEKITEKKKEINELNDEINKKLDELRLVRTKLDENNVQLAEEKKQFEEEVLKKKNLEVKEKLKTKKKLTTEDLLVLQRISE
jgi:uncharacterized coiled-coil DUF342 family protein